MSYFKSYSNKLTKIKANAKTIYFFKELNKHYGNPKKTRDTLRSLLSPRKTSKHVPHQLNNSLIDTVNQAENFNKFFCSVGEELANATSSHSDQDFRLYMKNRVIDTIYLEPPNTSEIANALLTLSVNKAVGYDNIPAFFLKVAPVLAPYLFYLLDYAFNNGIFPDNCKIATIIPIHKNGNQSNPSNYRPISILTCFSKIIERLIYKRLFSFISKNKILPSHQYGFQKKTSTAHAILDFVTASHDNIHHHHFTGIFFLDFKKAFDTVCHQSLIKKLEHYGIRGPTLSLLISFLKRQQFGSLQNVNSQVRPNDYRVPQVSILGPLLFLLYINDLPDTVQSTPILFADDTCLHLHSSKPDLLQVKLSREISLVQEWCHANTLTINPQKCHKLFISPKTNDCIQEFAVSLNDT